MEARQWSFQWPSLDEAASDMIPGLVTAEKWPTMDNFDDLFASGTEDSFEDWSVVEAVEMNRRDEIDRKRKREEGNGELADDPACLATQEKRSKLDLFVNNGNLALLASEDTRVQQDSIHSTNFSVEMPQTRCKSGVAAAFTIDRKVGEGEWLLKKKAEAISSKDKDVFRFAILSFDPSGQLCPNCFQHSASNCTVYGKNLCPGSKTTIAISLYTGHKKPAGSERGRLNCRNVVCRNCKFFILFAVTRGADVVLEYSKPYYCT